MGQSFFHLEWSMTYPAPELTLCESRTFEGDNRTDLRTQVTDVRWEFSSPVFRMLNHREMGTYETTNVDV